MSQAGVVGRPADRYGRATRSNRRTLIIVGTVFVILLTVWVGWIAVVTSDPGVAYSAVSSSTSSQTQAEITLQITMNPGKKAICRVQAKDAAMTVVGWSNVTVGPSSERTFTTTFPVPTMAQATTTEVKACVLA
jgi:Domain of unknown function (DUF4307)